MSPKTRGGPGSVVPAGEIRTYYDKPVLKAPVWKWQIPAYFFTGGLAGGSAVLSYLAGGRHEDRRLARTARWVGLAGLAVSPPLLIADLGRPGRFANMLRVFRPTSPMNVGSWLITAFSAAFVGGAALAEVPLLEPLSSLQPLAEGAAAVLGLGMATYTAVLVADTAVPAWHEARHELPFLFAGSAAASAGAAAVLFSDPVDARPARRMAVLGAAMEQGAVQVMEQRLGEQSRPYQEGLAGALSKVARAATLLGTASLALLGRHRVPARLGALLVLGGAAAERFAVTEAGRASAADPAYTVAPQRRRIDERSSG